MTRADCTWPRPHEREPSRSLGRRQGETDTQHTHKSYEDASGPQNRQIQDQCGNEQQTDLAAAEGRGTGPHAQESRTGDQGDAEEPDRETMSQNACPWNADELHAAPTEST